MYYLCVEYLDLISFIVNNKLTKRYSVNYND